MYDIMKKLSSNCCLAATTPSLVTVGTEQSLQIRVAIVINFITSYREDFYRRLLETEGLSLTIYCHVPPSHLNLISIHQKFAANVRLVTGKFFFGEKIVISGLPWRMLFSAYDVVYVEGNPRYLSLALLATLLRLTGRRVVLKVMVHSFRNSRLGLVIRLAWYRLFSHLLAYSDSEANYLTGIGFGGKIIGINNGLDYDQISQAAQAWPCSRLTAWRDATGVSGHILMLSCARLEKKNKFDQILKILPQLIERHPNLIWCVIGDGPERIALEVLTQQLGLASHIRFLGRIYDVNEQAPWFLSSQLLVHPGAIGLTLFHAMAFGLPVVTHRDAKRHGPEFAAMVAGQHGLTHREDAMEEIASTLLELLGDDGRCREMGQAGQWVVKDRYNTRVMVDRFLAMIERQWAGKQRHE
jgi:glycosyltransferase involved in cell wall biosynthesis